MRFVAFEGKDRMPLPLRRAKKDNVSLLYLAKETTDAYVQSMTHARWEPQDLTAPICINRRCLRDIPVCINSKNHLFHSQAPTPQKFG